VRLIVGFPSNIEELASPYKCPLIIFDDISPKDLGSEALLSAVTVLSHHKEVSFIFLTQQYFFQSRHGTTLRANCSNIVLMYDSATPRILSTINSQIFPRYPNFLSAAMDYVEATFPQGERYLALNVNPLSKLPKEFTVSYCISPWEKGGKLEPIYFQYRNV